MQMFKKQMTFDHMRSLKYLLTRKYDFVSNQRNTFILEVFQQGEKKLDI